MKRWFIRKLMLLGMLSLLFFTLLACKTKNPSTDIPDNPTENTGCPHLTYDGFCEICAKAEQEQSKTGVLAFALNSDNQSYTCLGFESGEISDVVIPDTFNELPVTEIKDKAFFGKKINSVLIPKTVTKIGAHAFEECYSMISVTFEENSQLAQIGQYAFAHCYDLASITLPSSVSAIATGAFQSCSDLTNITIPKNVSYMGDLAFGYCCNLSTVIFEDGCNLTSIGEEAFAECNFTSIVIPNSVTNIKSSAFYQCQQLTNITLSENLTDIGDYAFKYCYNLTNVIIPDNVVSIGNYAFSWCSTFTSIVIPDKVVSIGDYAFCCDENLTNIKIGKSVTFIGESAFVSSPVRVVYNDSDLNLDINQYATIKGEEITYKYNDGGYLYLFTEDKFLFRYYYEVSCDENRYYLLAYCGDETTVTLPAGINGAGYVVESVLGIVNMIIPDAKITIDENSHGSNTAHILKSITVDENNEYYKSIDGNLYSKDGKTLFKYAPAKKDTAFIIPEGVTTIADYACYSCRNLITVVLPNSLEKIESYAFSYCTMLENITFSNTNLSSIDWEAFYATNISEIFLPKSVTYIGIEAFGQVLSITVAEENKCYKSIDGNLYTKDGKTLVLYAKLKKEDYFAIPDGVTNIGAYAFSSAFNLKDVLIPNSVTSISNYAFEECDGLTNITIPDSVTSIGYGAFARCTKLSSVSIGNGVKELGGYAFLNCDNLVKIYENGIYYYNNWVIDCDKDISVAHIKDGTVGISGSAFLCCYSLTKVILPDSVAYINDDAFLYCKNLTCITLGNGLKAIGNSAFNECISLIDITIPDSVSTIGSYAFQNCHSLKSAIIGSGVNSIGEYAFYCCENLTDVTLAEGITCIGENMFDSCNALTGITIPNSVERIENGAFNYCSGLKKVSIGRNVNYIGNDAFNQCYSVDSVHIESISDWFNITFADQDANPLGWHAKLYENKRFVTELSIPEGITKINDFAFYGYNYLSNVIITDSVKSIGNYAFGECGNLTHVSGMNEVKSIGDYCFVNCYSLAFISGTNRLETIGNEAFYQCSGMTNITIPKSIISIGNEAFKGCLSLYVIYNNSDITLEIGNSDNGYLANYAKMIVINDGDGGISYITNSDTNYILTDDKFLFSYQKSEYCLIAYCGENDTITLPTNITYSIYMMRGAINVIVPDSITKIDYAAFYISSSLTSISFSDNLTSIGYAAFYSCNNLQSLTIPDSVTNISDYAFRGCDNVKSITLSKNVSYIGQYAFTALYSVEAIYYNNSESAWDQITIKEDNEDINEATLYYYSETEPVGEGNFWHYVDGEIVVW